MFNPAPKAVGEGGLADKYAELLPKLGCGCLRGLVARKDEDAPLGPELEAAGWQHVRACRAPEPDDVFWENLELRPQSRRERTRLSYMLLVLILLMSLLMTGTARFSQVYYHQNSALYYTTGDGSVPTRRLLGNLTISGFAALVILIVNLLIFPVSSALTNRECHPTRSATEESSFTKLILAYSVNTGLVPLLVACISYDHPHGEPATLFFSPRITQAWYESGGVVSQAIILIVSTWVVTDFNRVVQIPPLFQRYVQGHFAASQIKLNELWAPPRMELGFMYAETFKTLVLGLVYAPIYPPAFVLTSLALFSSFYSTKAGIAFWYMRPASVDGKLMKRMRNACQWLLLACVIAIFFATIQAFASRARQGAHTLAAHALPALITSIICWCCALCAGPVASRTRFFGTQYARLLTRDLHPSLCPVLAACSLRG